MPTEMAVPRWFQCPVSDSHIYPDGHISTTPHPDPVMRREAFDSRFKTNVAPLMSFMILSFPKPANPGHHPGSQASTSSTLTAFSTATQHQDNCEQRRRAGRQARRELGGTLRLSAHPEPCLNSRGNPKSVAPLSITTTLSFRAEELGPKEGTNLAKS